jgi:hypothetical protein
MTNERDDELKREIEDHLELETADRQADGLSPEEARHAAQRAFGSVLRATEDTRAVWSPIAIEQTRQDVRHALRSLVRQPMFAVVAVTTLALSIGVSTAIFSVVEAALLRPLPYPDPERLVAVYSVNRSQEVAPTRSGAQPGTPGGVQRIGLHASGSGGAARTNRHGPRYMEFLSDARHAAATRQELRGVGRNGRVHTGPVADCDEPPSVAIALRRRSQHHREADQVCAGISGRYRGDASRVPLP